MNDPRPLHTRVLAAAVPVLTLLAANFIVFRNYWTGDLLFSGKDLLTAFGPLLNFQTDCLQEGSLPLWNPFLNFGYPFVEHYSNTLLFPTHLLMGQVTGSTIELIQREMLFWIFLGGLGTYLCARELGRSQAASVAAGMGFMFCGQVIALPHWHLLVYNAACFPFLLLGYHRALRKEQALSLVAVLFLAFAILGGHITTAVLGLYLFGAYVLVDAIVRKRVLFGLRFLVVTGLCAALLALPKLLPMYHAVQSGPRMSNPASLYTKDPFNIINSYKFLSLLLPVKYFFSLYLGQLPVIAAVAALLRRALRVDALLLLAVLSAWLLMVDDSGTVSLLRSATLWLPFMKLVRNEWLVWAYPSVFALLALSGAVDRFLADPPGRAVPAAAAIVAAAVAATYLLAYRTDFAAAAVVQVLLAALAAALPLLRGRAPLQFAAVAVLLTVEFSLVFGRVAVDLPPQRSGGEMQIAVLDQGSISPRYDEDNTLRSGFIATAVQDRLRPPVSASARRPVLQSGLHGAPVINYAPEQYGMFIDDMNLKRFSGWWYNGQERFDFIRLMESGRLPAMEGLPLAAFAGPSGGPRPAGLDLEEVTCSSFRFRASAPGPGTFVLRQMFDGRWSAEVDGAPAPVLRAEGSFMAVDLAPGDHVVAFRFRDRLFTAGMIVSGCTLAGLLGWAGYRRRRPAPGAGAAAPGGA